MSIRVTFYVSKVFFKTIAISSQSNDYPNVPTGRSDFAPCFSRRACQCYGHSPVTKGTCFREMSYE